MRSTRDLRHEFDWVDATPVNTSDVLSRIQAGIHSRRIAHRRTAAVLSVAAASVLIAVGAIVISTLGSDQPAGGKVAATGSPTDETVTSAIPSPRRGFTVPVQPSGYPAEYEYTAAGLQSLTFFDPSDEVGPSIEVRLFDPILTGMPTPVPTGESIAVESASAGSLIVHVIAGETNGAEQTQFGLGWEVGDGEWLTIISEDPGGQARATALELAAQVVLGPAQPLRFPFQVGSPPTSFDLTGASRGINRDGSRVAGLSFEAAGESGYLPVFLLISAENATGVPEGFSPNTTLGQYQAQVIDPAGAGLSLSVFDVRGFRITVEFNGQADLDEAAVRRIAESIVVIPGAASDPTVWTDQPLG